jgi:hypothetical protein
MLGLGQIAAYDANQTYNVVELTIRLKRQSHLLRSKEGMELRNHPLMTYKGVCSWPPAWLWRGGYETTYPDGEVGILKDVTISPANYVLLNHGALWCSI